MAARRRVWLRVRRAPGLAAISCSNVRSSSLVICHASATADTSAFLVLLMATRLAIREKSLGELTVVADAGHVGIDIMVPHQHESHASRLLQETQLLSTSILRWSASSNNHQTFCPRETAANGTYQRALVAWCFIDTQRLRQFGDAFKDAGAGGRSG